MEIKKDYASEFAKLNGYSEINQDLNSVKALNRYIQNEIDKVIGCKATKKENKGLVPLYKRIIETVYNFPLISHLIILISSAILSAIMLIKGNILPAIFCIISMISSFICIVSKLEATKKDN